MTTRTINAWIMACVLAILMSSTWRLDDHSHEIAEAAALEDAIKAAQAADRLARAKTLLCGSENAVAVDISDVEIDCLTKRGHKTKRVAL